MILLIAPAVFGQTNPPGLVTVTAGVLGCGAVMRASNQIQTYCYAPVLQLVHNTISTVNGRMILTYQWCTQPNPQPAGCKPALFTAAFKVLAAPLSGISYQIVSTDPAGGLDQNTSGTLTAVYGTSGSVCPPLPVPWTGVVLDQNQVRVPTLLWTRNGEVCGTWNDGTGEFSCPPKNMFQVCGGALSPISWVAP